MKLLFLLCLLGSVFTSEAEGWKIGLGKSRITPAESIRMGGYAARDRPSEGVLTDLWVKAISFTDSRGVRSVLITADVIRFPKFISDSIRNELFRRHGLRKEQILLNASHTHSGPEVNVNNLKYMATEDELEKVATFSGILIRETLNAAEASLKNLFEARIYSGSSITRFAVNRRNNKEADILTLSELKGPFDHSVPVIKIVDKSDQVRALLFGYACHPTVLSEYQISGDYPAYAQMSLEKKFPGAQAMFFIGAAGDQNPLPRRSVALAIKYGEELALAVETACKSNLRQLEPDLVLSYREIDLKFRNPPPTRAELEAIVADPAKNPNWIINQARVLTDELSAQGKIMSSYPYPVQIWKLGTQPIVALGGEIVVEYSLKIKELLGDHTIVMGYSNDQMGYVPSRTVLMEGGYEGSRSPVFTTPWHENIEQEILQEIKNQVKKITQP